MNADERREAAIEVLREIHRIDAHDDATAEQEYLSGQWDRIASLFADDDPAGNRSVARPHGPPWRAAAHVDVYRHGILLQAARSWPDGRVEVLAGFEQDTGLPDVPARAVVDVETELAVRVADLGLSMPDDLGAALYRALGEHYGTTVDARTARADMEYERGAHAETRTALLATTQQLAQVALTVAGQNRVTVLGATEVINGDGRPRPADFERTGPIR